MFVAYDMSRGPPVSDIRVTGLGNQNSPEALIEFVIFFRPELKLVHPFQIERDGSLATVNFEIVIVLPACRKAAASNEPKAPFWSSASMNAASSTVTLPSSLLAPAPEKATPAPSAVSGRSGTNCAV
jgi:hypothetical protein